MTSVKKRCVDDIYAQTQQSLIINDNRGEGYKTYIGRKNENAVVCRRSASATTTTLADYDYCPVHYFYYFEKFYDGYLNEFNPEIMNSAQKFKVAVMVFLYLGAAEICRYGLANHPNYPVNNPNKTNSSNKKRNN